MLLLLVLLTLRRRRLQALPLLQQQFCVLATFRGHNSRVDLGAPATLARQHVVVKPAAAMRGGR